MGFLISETTKEERKKIVEEALGNIDASCDGCMAGLAEMYEEYKTNLLPLQTVFIKRHDFLPDGSSQITYENGTKIITNFNTDTFEINVEMAPEQFTDKVSDVLAMEKSLLSCLRALELPGQNSIFPCKGTVDRKNVKCRCRFQSEGLPAAFRKFSRYFKIWAFRPHSQTSHLHYLPFCPQWQSCTKNGSPGQEAQKASTKGKKNQINK